MPSRFAEYPGAEFLDFSEACELLPEKVVRSLFVFGIASLEPYARWGGSPALRPVPRNWLPHKGPARLDVGVPELVSALYLHSLLVDHEAAAHGGPTEPLEVYFFKDRVEEAASMLVEVPFSMLDVELPPWVAWKGRWAKSGRPTTRWRELVNAATVSRGDRLTKEAALGAINEGGVVVVETQSGFSFDGASVTKKSFTNALLLAAKHIKPAGD